MADTPPRKRKICPLDDSTSDEPTTEDLVSEGSTTAESLGVSSGGTTSESSTEPSSESSPESSSESSPESSDSSSGSSDTCNDDDNPRVVTREQYMLASAWREHLDDVERDVTGTWFNALPDDIRGAIYIYKGFCTYAPLHPCLSEFITQYAPGTDALVGMTSETHNALLLRVIASFIDRSICQLHVSLV